MTTARWLSESEQQVWRAYLASISRVNAHLDHQLQRDSGMPTAYYTILVALSEAPDYTMRMSDLAAACYASRSRLSHAVARLEKAGWVSRRGCPTDKRGSYAALTDEGMAALREAAPGHVNAVRDVIFDVLTGEQVRMLGEISAAIRDGMAAECAAAAVRDEVSSQ